MTHIPTLAAWLREQLDWHERLALAATAGPWSRMGRRVLDPTPPSDRLGIGMAVGHAAADADSNETAEHIAEHDPARVLRAVAVKRALVNASNTDCPTACRAEHSFSGSCRLRWMGPTEEAEGQRWVHDEDGTRVPAPQVVTEWALRLLGAEYADRPGWREEWRP